MIGRCQRRTQKEKKCELFILSPSFPLSLWLKFLLDLKGDFGSILDVFSSH